jgi:hypothetical protein
VRLLVGLVVFLPEGIQKLAFPEILGAVRFAYIAIAVPVVQRAPVESAMRRGNRVDERHERGRRRHRRGVCRLIQLHTDQQQPLNYLVQGHHADVSR